MTISSPAHRSSVCALTAALVIGLASPQADARIYKWVDENGVTQYTQTPPPKGEAEEIAPAPAPRGNPEETRRDLQDRLEAFNKRREEQARAERESAEESAAREQLAADCEKITDNLKILKSNPRLLEQQPDGTRTRLSEEQRQERIQRFTEEFAENCSDV